MQGEERLRLGDLQAQLHLRGLLRRRGRGGGLRPQFQLQRDLGDPQQFGKTLVKTQTFFDFARWYPPQSQGRHQKQPKKASSGLHYTNQHLDLTPAHHKDPSRTDSNRKYDEFNDRLSD